MLNFYRPWIYAFVIVLIFLRYRRKKRLARYFQQLTLQPTLAKRMLVLEQLTTSSCCCLLLGFVNIARTTVLLMVCSSLSMCFASLLVLRLTRVLCTFTASWNFSPLQILKRSSRHEAEINAPCTREMPPLTYFVSSGTFRVGILSKLTSNDQTQSNTSRRYCKTLSPAQSEPYKPP